MTSTYVLAQLSSKIEDADLLTGHENRALNQNKLTWSKLFLKQGSVQRLVTSYFEELDRLLKVEFINNWEQLSDFIRFPRGMKSY